MVPVQEVQEAGEADKKNASKPIEISSEYSEKHQKDRTKYCTVPLPY